MLPASVFLPKSQNIDKAEKTHTEHVLGEVFRIEFVHSICYDFCCLAKSTRETVFGMRTMHETTDGDIGAAKHNCVIVYIYIKDSCIINNAKQNMQYGNYEMMKL